MINLNEKVITKVLDRLGMEYFKSGENLMAECPNPRHDDSHPSWGINVNTGLHHCFSCGWGGTIYGLLEIYGTNLRKVLKNDYFLTTYSHDELKKKLRDKKVKGGNIQLMRNFKSLSVHGVEALKHIKYLSERMTKGIKVFNLVERFELGYVLDGDFVGRIVFPVRKYNKKYGDSVVMYGGRSIDCLEPKYRYPFGSRKSKVLYNYNYCKRKGMQKVIVVEGVFDVFKLWEMGVKNVVATFGSYPSKTHAHFLCSFKEVIMAYDNDEAGIKGVKKMASFLKSPMLNGLIKVYNVKLPEDRDVGEMKNLSEWMKLYDKAKLLKFTVFKEINV